MTRTIGEYGLAVAVIVAACTVLVSLGAVRTGSQGLRRIAFRGIHVLTLVFTVMSIALMTALADSDFSLEYVGKYTERALPMGYKLAAFWAGQAGSLLLWGWMVAVLASVFVLMHRKSEGRRFAVAAGVLAGVIGFFAALMLFAGSEQTLANPFQLAEVVPMDGHGLNPMLQNIGMIAHPPLLFMGYAGFAVPFALLVGALVCNELEGKWAEESRVWAMGSWVFLTVGIVLGAQWAYVELGWGGYWAWDPVENASLLPWLTGTALLHSLVGQKHRGMFRRWTATMAALTFALCIFGTYITRSGVVDSVHTFGKSMVGTFFGGFLILITVASVVLLAVRWTRLGGRHALDGLVTREGAMVAGNVLLVGMMAVTLWGTMYPAISKFFGDSKSVNNSFYNAKVLPMGIVLVGLMALAPVLGYGRQEAAKLVRGLLAPAVLGVVAAAAVWVFVAKSAWAVSVAAVAGALVAAIASDVLTHAMARARHGNQNIVSAVVGLVVTAHRRYGAQMVHAGLVMVVVGIVGSSLYGQKQNLQLRNGESAQVGKYTVRFDGLDEMRRGNHVAVVGKVTLTDAGGATTVICPEKRFYNNYEDQPNTEVALQSGPKEDLYVTLAGWDGQGTSTLTVIVNPLVWWIWAGGVTMTLGAIVCMIPARRPVEAIAVAPERAQSPARPQAARVALRNETSGVEPAAFG